MRSAQTDEHGFYELYLTPEDWRIQPHRVDSDTTAISAMDASYVLQAAYGSRWLSWKQQQACDVSGDGALDGYDAWLIMNRRAGYVPRFPVADSCGSDWIFDPAPAIIASQWLVKPKVEGDSCRPGSITLHPLNSVENQTFQAILFGDCTGNWLPNAVVGGAGFDGQRDLQATLRLGRIRRSRSGRMWMPVYVRASEPVFAVDLALRYDARRVRAAGVRVLPAARSMMLVSNDTEPGVLLMALAGAEALPEDRGAVAAIYFREVAPQRAVSAVSPTGVRTSRPAVRIDQAYVDEVPLHTDDTATAQTSER